MAEADPMDYGAQKDPNTEEVYFRFDEAAAKMFEKFSIALHKEIREHEETNPALAAHLGKFESLYASLALILFYAAKTMHRESGNEIPPIYTSKAQRLCDYYKAHALKVYDMESIEERRREALEEKIREKTRELLGEGKQPTFSEIVRRTWGAKTTKEVEAAIKGYFKVQGKKVIGVI